MKKLALTALFALLSACPMPGNDPATTPNPPQKVGPEACPGPIDPANPNHEVQEWKGQLPDSPPPRSVYVLMPLDEQQQAFLLTLTYPEKKEIIASYYLKNPEERTHAMHLVAEQVIAWPHILSAVLGGLRPLPQPGPPGEPGLAYQRSLTMANQMVWSEMHFQGKLEQQPGKVSSPTHGN
jgi:hypothetical protein